MNANTKLTYEPMRSFLYLYAKGYSLNNALQQAGNCTRSSLDNLRLQSDEIYEAFECVKSVRLINNLREESSNPEQYDQLVEDLFQIMENHLLKAYNINQSAA